MKFRPFSILFSLLTILTLSVAGCGGGDGSTEDDTTDTDTDTVTNEVAAVTLPTDGVGASPVAGGTGLSGLMQAFKTQSDEGAGTITLLTAEQMADELTAIADGAATDCAPPATINLVGDAPDPGDCYGPVVAFEDHPDCTSGDCGGNAPPGDTGIWLETADSGEACAIAKFNELAAETQELVRLAESVVAAAACALNNEGLSTGALQGQVTEADLPAAGESIDYPMEVVEENVANDGEQSSQLNFETATLAGNADGSYTSTFTGESTSADLGDTALDFELEQIHMPGGEAAGAARTGTYNGRMTFKLDSPKVALEAAGGGGQQGDDQGGDDQQGGDQQGGGQEPDCNQVAQAQTCTATADCSSGFVCEDTAQICPTQNLGKRCVPNNAPQPPALQAQEQGGEGGFGGNCNSSDVCECVSVLYQKVSDTEIISETQRAQFCAACADLTGEDDCFTDDGQVDFAKKKSGVAPTGGEATVDTGTPKGWGNDASRFRSSSNPGTGESVSYYAWQAGPQDNRTRTVTATVEAGAAGLQGSALFGFGPDIASTTETVGAPQGMICNWAFRGGYIDNAGTSLTTEQLIAAGLMQEKVQRQCFSQNSAGLFVPDSDVCALAIGYAPTNSCSYDGSGTFSYDLDADGTADTLPDGGVANELVDLSSVGFTPPAAPTTPSGS